jgi:glycosyltransferase involved in cell wall biosynthesis
LGECLRSIFSQEEEGDFEVIAIDDASLDNTQEVLNSIPDPRLKIITHKKNQGHVFTINEGFDHAKGVFVARIDPDDRYRPYFLSLTLPVFEKYPEVGLVYGDAALINEKGEITCGNVDRVHKGKNFKGNEYVALLEKNFLCAPTSIGRREAWNAALPIPDGLSFSDWYLSTKMAKKFDFYYIHNVLADYRVHPENWHSKIVADRSEEATIFRVLDQAFKEERPIAMQNEKVRARVYACNYATLGDKYFNLGMYAEAKRCYLQSMLLTPMKILDFGLLRRFIGTIVGRQVYEAVKTKLKSVCK